MNVPIVHAIIARGQRGRASAERDGGPPFINHGIVLTEMREDLLWQLRLNRGAGKNKSDGNEAEEIELPDGSLTGNEELVFHIFRLVAGFGLKLFRNGDSR